MEFSSPPRPRGRPRSFDRDEALRAAMLTFWRHGYEGTSIADLTEAMGITAPALYTAFKSKLDLYREVLGLYGQTQGATTWELLAGGRSAREAILATLRSMAAEFADPAHPRGCLISTAVLSCATENEAAAAHVAALREGAIAAFRQRIERGIAEGDLPADTDAATLARYCGAIVQGLSVQAQDGASAAELLAVVELAGSALPAASRSQPG